MCFNGIIFKTLWFLRLHEPPDWTNLHLTASLCRIKHFGLNHTRASESEDVASQRANVSEPADGEKGSFIAALPVRQPCLSPLPRPLNLLMRLEKWKFVCTCSRQIITRLISQRPGNHLAIDSAGSQRGRFEGGEEPIELQQ